MPVWAFCSDFPLILSHAVGRVGDSKELHPGAVVEGRQMRQLQSRIRSGFAAVRLWENLKDNSWNTKKLALVVYYQQQCGGFVNESLQENLKANSWARL